MYVCVCVRVDSVRVLRVDSVRVCVRVDSVRACVEG